ncbi:hypothetical protein L3Q82_004088 [Scortum barcoo]|uniref:Uncharacterized protein n=1 Tax=Scortum barcoo TaxID=214431 RepID=A0ACB8X6P8_9TELE|nr:hypothetical protein L3Q82_004088 [Scortum barcoo]
MAAAALSRRGLTGVRTTKGLFFIVTLLSLVCVASSLIDKDKLAEKATNSELISDYMSFMKPLIALVKQTKEASSDFSQLEGFLENIKVLMEKTYEQNEEFVPLGAKKDELRRLLVKRLWERDLFADESAAEVAGKADTEIRDPVPPVTPAPKDPPVLPGVSVEELQLTLRIKELEVRNRELEVEAMHLRVVASDWKEDQQDQV